MAASSQGQRRPKLLRSSYYAGMTEGTLAQMTTWHRPRSKTIWGRPHSNVPALRLESIELRDLLSRKLDEANVVLDEWDFAQMRDKQSETSPKRR